MRLSDAIWLGDSLKRGDAWTYLTIDGSCGCALGGALLAAGVNGKQFYREFYQSSAAFHEIESIKRLWPWLTPNIVSDISHQYCMVDSGVISLAQLCDYVRTIEPAEPEPENYEDAEEYWTDGKTTAELVNSIKGR